MGLAYVFALIVGMGILSIQALLGSKDADGDGFDKDVDFDAGGDADLDADADADADLDHDGGDVHVESDANLGLGGLVAVFLSLRFWVFASLGFGLSGTLLHYLSSVGAIPTFIAAVVLGLTSGLSAALAFRALKRMSSSVAEHTSAAVGRTGRVIVPLERERAGKIRIELGGQSVDLVARTEEGRRLERGDVVVIEEIDGEIAQVSRAPEELS